jgi:hypothetical protein
MHHNITAYYWHDDGAQNRLCNRSVSDVVLIGTVDLPTPPARLLADWEREMTQQLTLEPGDVEALALARARTRWPDYPACTQAAADWTRALGLGDVLASCDIALMACRGARYHHDAEQYGGSAFCNLFLTEDKGLDLHFPAVGLRIPLVRGTAVIFDTAQPHAVIQRGRSGFRASDFPAELDCSQVFLTWELPIENTDVAQALGVRFNAVPSASFESSESLPTNDAQVWLNGVKAGVCPESGRWLV